MKEERNIITIDKYGSISLPTDIGATAMTEWEICELFGVIAPTVRAGIKALCKSGVLREYDIKRTVRISDEYSAEVYNLETIAALAFRVESFGAAKVRKALLDRIMHGRKEKTTVFVSVVTDTEPPMDGVTVSRSGYQSVIQSYIHTVIPSHGRKGGVSRPQASGAIISVYKGKASTGLSVGFKVRRLRRQGNNLHLHSSGSILPLNLASDHPVQKSL